MGNRLLQIAQMNASTANLLSIIMLIFGAVLVEIVTNVTGNEIPPVTGAETNDDPKDTQRVNNGAVIGLGAVAGTLGLVSNSFFHVKHLKMSSNRRLKKIVISMKSSML